MGRSTESDGGEQDCGECGLVGHIRRGGGVEETGGRTSVEKVLLGWMRKF